MQHSGLTALFRAMEWGWEEAAQGLVEGLGLGLRITGPNLVQGAALAPAQAISQAAHAVLHARERLQQGLAVQ